MGKICSIEKAQTIFGQVIPVVIDRLTFVITVATPTTTLMVNAITLAVLVSFLTFPNEPATAAS